VRKRSRATASHVPQAALWVLLCAAASVRAEGARADQADSADRILKRSGVKGGLIVHLGCGDGRLTAALHAGEQYVVHGLDADAAAIAKAREHIRSLGLYGKVSVERLRGRGLPYTDNLVNLVVCGETGGVPMAEIMRVLAPRGVAVIRRGGEWARTVKPWPDDIDEWTHFFHGPDNNAVARDARVGPPRHMQWRAGPLWCRSHEFASSIAALVSARGRIFCVVDEGIIGQPRGVPAQWRLVARDAFNGVLLWKRPLPGSTSARCLVAIDEKVYVAFGHRHPLLILDAATGKTIVSCEGTEGTSEIVATEGLVVLTLRQGRKASLAAVDGGSGQLRWSKPAESVLADTLAAANGRVCYHNRREIVCLELRTGKELWRVASKSGRGGMLVIYRGAVLYTAANGLQAVSASTGKELWTGPRVAGRPPNLFGADGLVWRALAGGYSRSFLWTPQELVRNGYDPLTGSVERTVTVKRLITPGHHYRCYPPKATDRYLLLHKRGVEFVDLKGGNHMRHNWLRGPCRHGVVPANGLLYVPPHQCFCYPGVKLTGFNVVCAEIQDRPRQERPLADRLERGPAWPAGQDEVGAPGKADWPMYRHDARRSGRADCGLPVRLTRRWAVRLGKTLTPPVVADGRLFVAEEDAHTVHCRDARSGKALWSYTAGGRVDSPPTLHEQLVLFGSADGWVYCLRASDGKLIWRFRAAPEQRRVAAFGQIESAWPVHGSVMVQNGRAYVTAGRSSYLDGGIYAYALEPKTGKVLHETRLWSGRPDVSTDAGRPFDMEGTRSDILVSDGEDLYMFHARFAPDLTRKATPRITKLGDREVGPHLMCNDGFLDKTWFNRSYWTYSRRWPGYYFAYKGPKAGQILSFDETMTYGVHVYSVRRGHSPEFLPGTDGYELFADRNSNEPVLRPTEIGREKGLGYFRSELPKWTVRVPVRVVAMVLAGERLYIAGPPDVVPPEDPLAAFEGRMGARLWVVSATDGKKLAEYELDRVPVFDGMIAARGRLYVVTADGQLVCME